MQNIKQQLSKMFARDQQSIHNTGYFTVARQHAECLREIIDSVGWPHSGIVGEEGELAAWLIAQHADHDVAFQQRCLELLQQYPLTPARETHIRYLTDRVLINTGQPQRYGTQE